MRNKWILVIVLITITLGLIGCNQPNRRITDEEMMLLARLTVEAGMTETAAARPPKGETPTKSGQQKTPTDQSPEKSREPSNTATITLTPTETLTPTLSKVTVSVSLDTNCRFGPGEVYPYLGALMVGEEAEVIARGPHKQYWVIKNPDAPGECWIWGEYADIKGPADKLPVRKPPPTPTPSKTPSPTPQAKASAYYYHTNICGATQYIYFQVWNDGNIPLESAYIDSHNATQQYRVQQSSNTPFVVPAIACPPGESTINPGDAMFIAVADDAYVEASHVLEVDIRLCSGDNLSGSCTDVFVLKTP